MSNGYEYAIESVSNATHVLLMLRDRQSIRAVDVATELGVARSTAHRLVSTLQQSGMLRRNDADKSYSAGYALVELGMAVLGEADLHAEIAPILTALAAKTGETAHFLVRKGEEVLFVAVAESSHLIRAASRVGTRLPAHVTAAGRCMLAAMNDEELSLLYPPDKRLSGGSGFIRTTAQLTQDLIAIREQGYAINDAQSEPGLMAVSQAVIDRNGRPLGAISVSGPTDRVTPQVAELAEELRQAIARLDFG
ncbi:MAG: IclR family transcriptional regulator [Microbacteriaceae bacterium]|nr:IclR family transcriptional regulator [Microbacteriaceae bacterium]